LLPLLMRQHLRFLSGASLPLVISPFGREIEINTSIISPKSMRSIEVEHCNTTEIVSVFSKAYPPIPDGLCSANIRESNKIHAIFHHWTAYPNNSLCWLPFNLVQPCIFSI
jgi:hypothetical protein